ncbi:vigilin-like isoform X2 [Antennarius striatus]|uniref:vigilin-like isoform X2 n=1 Tax=Antennarius striatus TaxID=241820 RepID=UPI0035AF1432
MASAGWDDAMKKAEKEIMARLQIQVSSGLVSAHQELTEERVSISVPIQKQFHRSVIGRGGSTIRRIQKETNTIVSVPPQNSKSNEIIIEGQKGNCEAAKRLMMHLQEELTLMSFQVTVRVNPRHFSRLIGPMGVLMQYICDEHNVKVHFPEKKHEKLDQITITGYKNCVLEAQKVILDTVSRQGGRVTEDVTLDRRVHHKIFDGEGERGLQFVLDKFKPVFFTFRWPSRSQRLETPTQTVCSSLVCPNW